MDIKLSAEQIKQAIQNTEQPLINKSNEVYQALINSEIKKPCSKHGSSFNASRTGRLKYDTNKN